MAAAPEYVTLTEAAERMGVHYMTAYRYVRTGRLPATKDGQEWQVAVRDIDALRAGTVAPAAAGTPRRGRRADYARRLGERLVRADEPGAWAVIETAMAAGMEPEQVYLLILTPALDAIGRQWESGEITVAEEHQASAIVLRLIGRLGPRFARRGRKRGVVLVGAPPHDVHGIPSALFGDLLRGRGFDVVDLGADVPADSWATTAADLERLIAVGMCATTSANEPAVAEAIASLRAATTVPIVLGGRAIGSDDAARRLGATCFTSSFEDAVARIELIANTRAA
jgi:excisionase family DNA binding protein